MVGSVVLGIYHCYYDLFLYVFVFIYNIYNKRRLLVTVFMGIIALMVLSSAVFSRGYSGL